jgi:hypothetical protein
VGASGEDRSPRNRSPKAGGKAERKQAKARKRQKAEARSEVTGAEDARPAGGSSADAVPVDKTAAGGDTEEIAAQAASQHSPDATHERQQPAAAVSTAAVHEAPVRPVEVDVDAARREREFKAEQRRAERVAQKADDIEATQKPRREPIAMRLRREAGGAIRDALGR